MVAVATCGGQENGKNYRLSNYTKQQQNTFFKNIFPPICILARVGEDGCTTLRYGTNGRHVGQRLLSFREATNVILKMH